MDNLKLPAHPELVSTNKQAHGPDFKHYSTGGFTKLELASLMIGAGMSGMPKETIARVAVANAKAILEEANK